MICKWLQEKNEISYFGVALLLTGIGSLSVLFGSSKLLDLLIAHTNWLHFMKGLFCGLSFALLIAAIVISIQGLNYLKHKN